MTPSLRKLHTRLASVAPAPPVALHIPLFQHAIPRPIRPSSKPFQLLPHVDIPPAKTAKPMTRELEAALKPAIQAPTGEFLAACPEPALLDIVKWRLTRDGSAQLPHDLRELDVTLPVLVPDFTAPIPLKHARITWLGHASVLVEVPLEAPHGPHRSQQHMTFLTDAVFSDRCSPSQLFGPARYRPCPVTVATLPHVDAVLLSHNHYDHMDMVTLRALHAAQPHVHYFVPLNNASYLMQGANIPRSHIHEQNWWDADPLSKAGHTFHVSCVPAKHWSKRRAIGDTNKALWGGWVVQGRGGSFYFAGDTAYEDSSMMFQAIHHRFGDQSVAAIPIGAYGPRELFKNQHVNVQDAVQIHFDVGSRKTVGIHWGTWQLTDEPYLEPKQTLAALMAHESEATDAPFVTFDHGGQEIVPWTL